MPANSDHNSQSSKDNNKSKFNFTFGLGGAKDSISVDDEFDSILEKELGKTKEGEPLTAKKSDEDGNNLKQEVTAPKTFNFNIDNSKSSILQDKPDISGDGFDKKDIESSVESVQNHTQPNLLDDKPDNDFASISDLDKSPVSGEKDINNQELKDSFEKSKNEQKTDKLDKLDIEEKFEELRLDDEPEQSQSRIEQTAESLGMPLNASKYGLNWFTVFLLMLAFVILSTYGLIVLREQRVSNNQDSDILSQELKTQ